MRSFTRIPSKVQVAVRGAVLGGPRPLICIPLVAALRGTVVEQAGRLAAMQPDIIEWRIDGYAEVDNLASSLRLLGEVRQVIGTIPLLFTCRMAEEGGLGKIATRQRRDLCTAAIGSGDIDIVDVELANPPEFLAAVRETARASRIPLLLSSHNFVETPDEGVILDILRQAVAAGADIVKVAVTPRDAADVLTLLRATNRARQGLIEVPVVTVSMGSIGMVSRIVGGLFGSDLTFAVGLESSAPGQLPIDELRRAMALLYRDT